VIFPRFENSQNAQTWVIPGNIHHRGAEFAAIGEFFNNELFTPRPEPVLSDVEARLRSSAGSLRPEPSKDAIQSPSPVS
jgi:hypothetical protein